MSTPKAAILVGFLVLTGLSGPRLAANEPEPAAEPAAHEHAAPADAHETAHEAAPPETTAAGHESPAAEPAAHGQEATKTDAAGHEEAAKPAEHQESATEARSQNHGTTEGHGNAEPKAGSSLEESRHKEARGLLSLGAKLADRGDFAASEIAYWQILHNRSYATADQCDALLALARMHRKQGSLTKASAVYERFLKMYPDDARTPDALLELGRSQRAMGAYKNAINRFYSVINSTLKLPPESYEHYQLLAKTAQFEIAETHFETGNFAEAAKFFDRLRLLDLAPEDRARAHFKSAYSLLNGGQTEKAAAKFQQFIDQWPNDANVPEARYLLALTLRQLGRTEEALAITLTLLRAEHSNAGADPKTWAYWQRRTGNQLANDFFQHGDTLSAVAIYDGLAHLSDSPAWRLPIVYQMGLCYERLHQSERATQAYREIVEAVRNPAGKEPVSSELADLGRMAEWRIGQLEWSGQTESHLNRFFSSTTAAPKAASPTPPTPPAPAPAAHESHDDPATAPRAL